jgi:hypothetical protein
MDLNDLQICAKSFVLSDNRSSPNKSMNIMNQMRKLGSRYGGDLRRESANNELNPVINIQGRNAPTLGSASLEISRFSIRNSMKG